MTRILSALERRWSRITRRRNARNHPTSHAAVTTRKRVQP